ncbi:MAG: hypothetical protein DME24_11615 [Verrucomicrobia bacterium]|nr:MAG: hypothetical protein DME24_11615 [Verrucomicrobiota bacterium]
MGYRKHAMKPGLKIILATVVCLTITSTATAQLRESERTLNLKSLQRAFAHATGKRLLLGVTTNHVYQLLSLINWEPSPVKKLDSFNRQRKVQIVFGKDLLGFAEVSLASGSAAHKPPKIKLVYFALAFETEVQAARAAEALRLPAVTPQPIQSRKNHK